MDVKEYQQLTNRAYTIRGLIINEAIFLERVMDGYIANHFCSTDELRTELKISLLSTERILFENKRQIFKFLIDIHNKEFVKKYPNLCTDIQTIIEERNIVAHHMLDTSKEGIALIKDGSFRLMKYRNSVTPFIFDNARIKKTLDLITYCTKAMIEIVNDFTDLSPSK